MRALHIHLAFILAAGLADVQANEEYGQTAVAVTKVTQRSLARNYHAYVSASEVKDLRFILRMLAHSSLMKISWNSSALKKAGERLEHLHPFKFLECIFNDEELTSCVRHIQGRSWVWREFLEGITESLRKESAVGNLKPHLKEFAVQVDRDVKSIAMAVHKQRWKELVNDLIAHQPR